MGGVLARGTWCVSCGFFEDIEEGSQDAACPACGCPLSAHKKVAVVEEDENA